MRRLAAWDPFPATGEQTGGLRRYVLLDVFAEAPLQGNQLAVFTDARGLEAQAMQALARELRLSESVFLLPATEGGDARARIFTPSAELPFAGHPVLGAGALVAAALGAAEVRIETAAGPVPVTVGEPAPRSVLATMSQPLPEPDRFPAEAELLAALGLDRSELPVEAYRNGPRHVYVALRSRAAVAALMPDSAALERCAAGWCVSCFAGAGRSFKTRMFAPSLGVAEDPATGSAAGPLAVHLARHGVIPYGEEIEISQGAEILRPSLLRARVEGRRDALERVLVAGRVAPVGRGELLAG